jgi:hypothetical protein
MDSFLKIFVDHNAVCKFTNSWCNGFRIVTE